MSRRFFAIADLHLSGSTPKSMDVFGPRWHAHAARLAELWPQTVTEDDVVLIPGDISWAMRLDAAAMDLEFLDRLPGQKVLLRGNHDYWWSSLSKMQGLGLSSLHYLHNNHFQFDGVAVGGSRLWDFPGIGWLADEPEPGVHAPLPARKAAADPRPADDERIREHELQRLHTSLSGLPESATVRIAMTHFPPLGEYGEPTPLTEIMDQYRIDICVFGHIHGEVRHARPAEDITINQTRYLLVAGDHLGFTPRLLTSVS